MNVSADELAKRLETFKARAKEERVKLTPQRLEIFKAVAKSLEHPDAERIFETIHASMPTVSLDTVYRTLWLLEDLGLLSTIGSRRGGTRFDANLKTHHHFVCTRCGMIRDFVSPALDALPVPEEAKAFGQVSGSRVEVRGLCERCLRKASREAKS
jgi:Fur family peroxide stress response transcriptional regulator